MPSSLASGTRDEQIEWVARCVQDHFAATGGRLPLLGRIRSYAFRRSLEDAITFDPQGRVTNYFADAPKEVRLSFSGRSSLPSWVRRWSYRSWSADRQNRWAEIQEERQVPSPASTIHKIARREAEDVSSFADLEDVELTIRDNAPGRVRRFGCRGRAGLRGDAGPTLSTLTDEQG